MHWREMARRAAPKAVTIVLVAVAVIAAMALYRRWVQRPWTRDGQVRADIIEIAPRVSGYIVRVAVMDNQFVRKGALLFEIDPRSYELAVAEARVRLDQARNTVASLTAAVTAADAKVAEAEAAVAEAAGQVTAAERQVEAARADVAEAAAGAESAEATIRQRKAELAEAEKEARRAKRLLEKKAESVENAEKAAAVAQAKQAQLDSAHAGLDEARARLAQAIAGQFEKSRAQLTVANDSLARTEAALATARANRAKAAADLGEGGEGNVRIRQAKVQLAQAELNLEWTAVRAPCEGYATNLNVQVGDSASAGVAMAAFVDRESFRVDGYFQETKLKHIHIGDAASITLMGRPDLTLAGVVESVGHAVNPPDIADTQGPRNLVPTIQPTFDWVRLPQRAPVRVRLTDIPEGLRLISGTTASVAIRPRRRD